MRFSDTLPVKIVLLGAGGTGGHIAPHLYRLAYALDREVEIIIVDTLQIKIQRTAGLFLKQQSDSTAFELPNRIL